MHELKHKAVITDQTLADIQIRNQARQQAAIKQLGRAYAHHPVNHIQRRK